jgi:hypothetical protein
MTSRVALVLTGSCTRAALRTCDVRYVPLLVFDAGLRKDLRLEL